MVPQKIPHCQPLSPALEVIEPMLSEFAALVPALQDGSCQTGGWEVQEADRPWGETSLREITRTTVP